MSLFGVPEDVDLRENRKRNLHRADKQLDEWSGVRELQLKPPLIIRDYVHYVDGKKVRIQRGRVSLTPDAVPTLLPASRNICKTTAKPRNRKRNLHDTSSVVLQNAKRSQSCTGGGSHVQVASEDQSSDTCNIQLQSALCDLRMLSKCWSILHFPNFNGVMYVISTINTESVDFTAETIVFIQFPISKTLQVYAVKITFNLQSLLSKSPFASKDGFGSDEGTQQGRHS